MLLHVESIDFSPSRALAYSVHSSIFDIMSTISISFCRPLFPSLGDDLTIQDANGNIKAGVGIHLQHEWRYGVYVHNLTPKGPGMSVQLPPCAHSRDQRSRQDVQLCGMIPHVEHTYQDRGLLAC